MTTTRVLILGGTSYVAQFLCARFLDGWLHGAATFACTVRSADAQRLPPGLELATTDAASSSASSSRVVRVFTGVSLLELDTVKRAVDAFAPTVVINCIALSSPAACERDPAMARALNHPSELMAYLRGREKPLQYVHFSTDFVFDGRAVPPRGFRENDATVSAAHCVYSATKLAFDQHLLSQTPSPHVRTTILRVANVVGGPAPLFSNQPPKFAQWLFQELLRRSSPDTRTTPVRLWKDEVRSFLFVDDLVSVLWRLVILPTSDRQQLPMTYVLNVGGVDAMSRVQFGERLVREYRRLYPETTTTCRPIEQAERALVDLGYQTPLDARLDCSALHSLLPDFAFTTTDEIMRELCCLMHNYQ